MPLSPRPCTRRSPHARPCCVSALPDRNHAQADDTRKEREERRRFKLEQKELYRTRGVHYKDQQKSQMSTAANEVQGAREQNAQLGSSIRDEEEKMRKRRMEQQKKWADHGYELTQQYTIKAAQNNMRSLKAQNAGIVNGMHAKREDNKQVRRRTQRPATDRSPAPVLPPRLGPMAHAPWAVPARSLLGMLSMPTRAHAGSPASLGHASSRLSQIVESQRAAAQDERRQRVAQVRSETTDAVTRNAKKQYVDERWDVADAMREKAEAWRAQRKAQELAYLEQALAINASTSMAPAKAAREKARDTKAKASQELRERKKQIKDQALQDDSSYGQAKAAIHDSIHGLKFVPDEEVKSVAAKDSGTQRLKPFFSFRTPSRRTAPHEVTL